MLMPVLVPCVVLLVLPLSRVEKAKKVEKDTSLSAVRHTQYTVSIF
jgi:hypothetical protein